MASLVKRRSDRPAQCRESCSANQLAATDSRRSMRRGGSFSNVQRCRLQRMTVSSICRRMPPKNGSSARISSCVGILDQPTVFSWHGRLSRERRYSVELLNGDARSILLWPNKTEMKPRITADHGRAARATKSASHLFIRGEPRCSCTRMFKSASRRACRTGNSSVLCRSLIAHPASSNQQFSAHCDWSGPGRFGRRS